MHMGKTPINVFLGGPFSKPPVRVHRFTAQSVQSPGKELEMPPPMPLCESQRTGRWTDPKEGTRPMPASGLVSE